MLRHGLLRHVDLGGEPPHGVRPLLEQPENLDAPRFTERFENDARTIRHEVTAKCSPDRVWRLLADLEAVQRYNPGVRAAKLEGEKRTGIGARRSCELLPNGRVVEAVTHWEEGRALGLQVEESDWPIHFMRWVTRLEPAGSSTRITQDLEYRVKFGPLGWILDRLVMKRKLTSTLDAVFAELVKHAEAS